MALVSSVKRDDRDFKGIHQTSVEFLYLVGERDGKKVIQLNTYGSEDREIPNKLSQTIQFDRAAAEMLVDVLRREFGI
jgi:hypothetical protein